MAFTFFTELSGELGKESEGLNSCNVEQHRNACTETLMLWSSSTTWPILPSLVSVTSSVLPWFFSCHLAQTENLVTGRFLAGSAQQPLHSWDSLTVASAEDAHFKPALLCWETIHVLVLTHPRHLESGATVPVYRGDAEENIRGSGCLRWLQQQAKRVMTKKIPAAHPAGVVLFRVDDLWMCCCK